MEYVVLTIIIVKFLSDLFYFFPADPSRNMFIRVWHYIVADPWMGFILLMTLFHFTWVYLLLVSQIFQVLIKLISMFSSHCV